MKITKTQRKQAMVNSLIARGFDLSEVTTHHERLIARFRCSQCQPFVINGVATHKDNCPNSNVLNQAR